MVIEAYSSDDLAIPLAEVTFCVVDLETTGAGPGEHAITEIGAVKTRRGEVLGTFQTLVDPGEPVPYHVTLITGIHDGLVRGAPPLTTILPSFVEFCRGTALVAHNAAFDMGFLDAACARAGYPYLENPVVDTARLARRALIEEVPDRKLATLATHFRCEHQPRHRALDDALATLDVLHSLIERMTGFGVTTLAGLLAFATERVRIASRRGYRSGRG